MIVKILQCKQKTKQNNNKKQPLANDAKTP